MEYNKILKKSPVALFSSVFAECRVDQKLRFRAVDCRKNRQKRTGVWSIFARFWSIFFVSVVARDYPFPFDVLKNDLDLENSRLSKNDVKYLKPETRVENYDTAWLVKSISGTCHHRFTERFGSILTSSQRFRGDVGEAIYESRAPLRLVLRLFSLRRKSLLSLIVCLSVLYFHYAYTRCAWDQKMIVSYARFYFVPE